MNQRIYAGQIADICARAAQLTDETFCRGIDGDLKHLQNVNADFAMLVRMQAVLVADCMDQLVGYLRAEHIFLKIPYISCIRVLPAFRRKGVGKSLLNEMVKRQRASGASYVLSSSEAHASEAIAWHKHNGFYEIGALQHMNQDAAAEVFFRLDISE